MYEDWLLNCCFFFDRVYFRERLRRDCRLAATHLIFKFYLITIYKGFWGFGASGDDEEMSEDESAMVRSLSTADALAELRALAAA